MLQWSTYPPAHSQCAAMVSGVCFTFRICFDLSIWSAFDRTTVDTTVTCGAAACAKVKPKAKGLLVARRALALGVFVLGKGIALLPHMAALYLQGHDTWSLACMLAADACPSPVPAVVLPCTACSWVASMH